MDVYDTILEHRIGQMHYSNKCCQPSVKYQINDLVYFSTKNLTLLKHRAQKCWGTYAYIHICTKSIQIYLGIFFDFILVLLSFHCSHTIPIFSEFFPIFPAILFTSKACHFDTALLILLPFKRPRSRASCGIKLYYMQRARSLRRAERS